MARQLVYTKLLLLCLLLGNLSVLQAINYYVDPIIGSDLNDGTQPTPFRTLTAALIATPTLTSNINIQNPTFVEVELLAQLTVTVPMTIQPTNPENGYAIVLPNFDGSNISADPYAIRVTGNGYLTIKGLTLSPRSNSPGEEVKKFFSLVGGQLKLNNITVIDLQSIPNLVSAAGPIPKLTINTLSHANSSATFSLTAGTHSIKNARIVNNKVVGNIFNIFQAGALYLSYTFITGGNALIINAQEYSQVYGSFLEVDGYDGNFVICENSYYCSFETSSFKNLNLNTTSSFISYIGTNPASTYAHQSQQLEFSGIHTATQLIAVTQYRVTVSFEFISMDDITKTQNLHQYLCADFENEANFWLFNSTFTRINANCLYLNEASISLESNTFDNTNLSPDVVNPEGVRWLTINNGSTMINVQRLSHNRFINNTLPPIYGGALQFDGTFVGFASFQNNTFYGNKASQIAGGVFVKNPRITCTLLNNTFTKNIAVQGAAFAPVNDPRLPGNGAKMTLLGNLFDSNENLGNSNWTVTPIPPTRLEYPLIPNNVYIGNV